MLTINDVLVPIHNAEINWVVVVRHFQVDDNGLCVHMWTDRYHGPDDNGMDEAMKYAGVKISDMYIINDVMVFFVNDYRHQ